MRNLFLLFCAAILLTSGCVETRPEKETLNIDGPDSAKTVDEIKRAVLLGKEWKIHNVDGLRILVGISELPTSGESYIDVHGYVYNQSLKEWRRFCLVKTRNVGWGEILIDTDHGVLYLLAKANNDLEGKRVFQIDIGVLSDDRGYVRESIEQKDSLDDK